MLCELAHCGVGNHPAGGQICSPAKSTSSSFELKVMLSRLFLGGHNGTDDTTPAIEGRRKIELHKLEHIMHGRNGENRMKNQTVIVLLGLFFTLSLVADMNPSASAAPSSATQVDHQRSNWPNQLGVYTATSNGTIPAFPASMSGYRSQENKDFWNKPFPVTGSIRVFQGQGWEGILHFPNTMNGCSAGIFMIRWRTSSPSIPVQSSIRYSSAVGSHPIKLGAFGYMAGTSCEQPMFKFSEQGLKPDNPARTRDTLVDVIYELKFWQTAP